MVEADDLRRNLMWSINNGIWLSFNNVIMIVFDNAVFILLLCLGQHIDYSIRPTIGVVFVEIMIFFGPVWIAFLVAITVEEL